MTILSDPARAALVIGLLLAIIIVLLLFIWSIKRHRSPSLHIESDQPIDKLLASLAGLSLGTPIGGNSVEIFENGALLDVMIDDIAAAERSVQASGARSAPPISTTGDSRSVTKSQSASSMLRSRASSS